MMDLCSFEKALQEANNLNQINAVLTNYYKSHNIITFAFTYYAKHANCSQNLKYEFVSENYKPWHMHYLSEGYEDVDTTHDYTHRHTLPTFWNLQTQLKEAKTERERNMRLDSISFGVEEGYSIPIHGSGDEVAIMLVAQMQNQKNKIDWPGIKYELFAAAYLYYHYLQLHLISQQASKSNFALTSREIECLLLVAKRAPVAEIATQLEISERTVNFHIQKINKKLGVKNKHQAVTKAIEEEIITI